MDEPQQDRPDDRLRLALREWRGPVLRPAHGRGEPEGEEVRERNGRPRALSWYAAICALYDELEGDDKELDEEVDDMGLCGRIEHDGEEVDEGAEDLVGDCEAGVA